MHTAAGIALAILILNGMRVVIGVPPVAYWFRSRRCPVCDGVGFVRFHSHTGEIADVPVDVLRERACAPSMGASEGVSGVGES